MPDSDPRLRAAELIEANHPGEDGPDILASALRRHVGLYPDPDAYETRDARSIARVYLRTHGGTDA